MYTCPICQTAHKEHELSNCLTCGWDLTPYALTFAGTIPDSYLAKEKFKLAWAQETWFKLQQSPLQEEFEQLQQEKVILAESVRKLELQVKRLLHEKQNLNTQISQLEQDQLQLQSQDAHLTEEKSRLIAQLSLLEPQIEQATQERKQLQQRINSVEQERSRIQTTSDALTQEKQDLLEQNKLLKQENSELQLHLNREQIRSKAASTRDEAELTDLKQQNVKLRTHSEQIQTELDQLRQENKQLRDQLVNSRVEDDLWKL